jgi:hypothetical protein
MHVHVVELGLVRIDANGNPIAPDSAATINEYMTSSHETRVLYAADVPNSAGYPTIKTFLTREAASNYKLQHLTQTYIITYDA